MTRPKILLFDQDDCVRDTMQQSLEAVRIEVRSVANVSDALEVLLREDVDGMVIDLQMQSEEEGRCLMTAIQHFQSNALVVAVSDSLNVEQAKTAMRLQADIVVRPRNVQQVANHLREKAQRRRCSSTLDGDRVITRYKSGIA
jgi:DNA-binding NtrC family response regulator